MQLADTESEAEEAEAEGSATSSIPFSTSGAAPKQSYVTPRLAEEQPDPG